MPRAPRVVTVALAVVVTASTTFFVVLATRGSDAVCAATPARAPDLQVTALPGVDLRPVLALPGLAASSGPFPGATTSVRRGGREISVWLEGRPHMRSRAIVLDSGLARRLGTGPGRRVTLATAHGPARVRIASIATAARRAPYAEGVAYASVRDLRRVAPDPHVRGSTIGLELADGSGAGAFAQWLERRYPARQAYVVQGAGGDCGQT